MTKSFKKVIACLLAVLMVVFAAPISALAAPGDYTPDIDLQFGTFYDSTSGSWTEFGTASGDSDVSYCGMYDAKVTYDKTAGTLTLKKSDADQAADILDVDSIDADYTYGVGNYFTVTVLVKNIKSVSTFESKIAYSDNVEPAGVYTYKSGRTSKVAVGTESERAAASSGAWVADKGGTSALSNMSCSTIYGTQLNYDTVQGTVSDKSKAANGYIDAVVASSDGTKCDVTSTSSPEEDIVFTNPTTGDMADGYTYENTLVAATFAFKITGEGAIKFSMYDPDNSISGDFTGGLYIADIKADGMTTDKYTTYAVNEGAAGSTKMTFMGTNSNTAEPEPEHTHTYGDWTHVDGSNPSQHTRSCTAGDDTQTEDCSFGSSVKVQPTYTTMGTTTYTCSTCGYSYDAQDIPALTCDHANTEVRNAVAATCVATGYTGDTYCTTCGAKISEGTTIPVDPTNHVGTIALDDSTVVTATCVATGYTGDTKCSACGNVVTAGTETPVDSTNHVGPIALDETTVKAATVKDAGYTGDTVCAACKAVVTAGTATDALGVNVTVADTYSSLGKVSGANYGVNNVAYGTAVTLVATPADGAQFVGYEVAGKMVSTDATYTVNAYTDQTITPVFAEKDSDKITVTFLDKYNNVVKTYANYTVADYQAAVKAEAPVAPAYAGFTFTGWNVADITAISASTTVKAYYTRDEGTTFTVTTTDGATIDGTDSATEGLYVFDSQVTVSCKDATAWTVDGNIVGYGDSYTFYVGSDITVSPMFTTVTAKPNVAMVNYYNLYDSYKVMFLATLNIPSGYTLVDHGFVYGKNLTDAELDLANVGTTGASTNAGVVKKTSLGTSAAEQFGISYGVKNMDAAACAKAYVQYLDENNDVVTIYGDAATFDYAE